MRFFLLFLFSLPLSAQTLVVTSIASIYDGDTFRANLPGCQPLFCSRIPIRVNGIDAPEIRGKCEREKFLARKAKQLAVHLLRSAGKVEIRNPKRGKYFRIIGDVFVDGRSLADILIKSGLAREYHGGKRRSWCSTNYVP